jgi:aspartate-semialdehyde dehydrogenase
MATGPDEPQSQATDEDELALARAAGVLAGGPEDRESDGASEAKTTLATESEERFVEARPESISVAVVGATGLVGQEMVRILEERRFPVSELRLYASEKSKGKPVRFGEQTLVVDVVHDGCFEGVDLVLMEVESELSRDLAPVAVSEGATVIDNSSAWRMDKKVPLVVTEVNPQDLEAHDGIIANPNCTTMVLMPVLAPLHRHFGARRLVITTLQSVSGSGQKGIAELERQTQELMIRPSALRKAGQVGISAKREIYSKPIAFNVVPQCDDFADPVSTKEELKLRDESRKILSHPDLQVMATCVRVPVFVGHSLSVLAEFERPAHVEEVLDILADAPGVELMTGRDFPTPLDVAGVDGSWVGRIRPDPTKDGAVAFWVTGDNLRKGAALNCIEIAEILVSQGWLVPVSKRS